MEWNGIDAVAVAVALTGFICGKICFVVASMQLFSVNAPEILPKHENIHYIFHTVRSVNTLHIC